MNIKTKFFFSAALTFTSPAFAYDIANHFDMTGAAFDSSVLSKPKTLERFGLKSLAKRQTFSSTAGQDVGDLTKVSANCTHGTSLLIRDLFMCGAMFEDVPGTRSLNHFFDPAHGGAPFTILGVRPGNALGLSNRPSPDWALKDNNDEPQQAFSYKDARANLFQALTSMESLNKRNEYWGKVFQSVGQVVHHLQDMAQPQHARNDNHFELPVNIPGITNPSAYEKYTGLRDGGARDLITQYFGAEAVYPGSGNANTSRFSQPRKFWANGGSGIAEFTNANFVSARTNLLAVDGDLNKLRSFGFPTPTGGAPEDITLQQLFNSTVVPAEIVASVTKACDNDLTTCYMGFVTTIGPNISVPRGSSYSMFDQDLQVALDPSTISDGSPTAQYNKTRMFTLNRFNFDAVYPALIPKAVGYSAGLINYFFRGELQISLPADGVYSIVDHAVQNTPNTSGFRYLRAKVKNLTPREMLNGGNFYAIAKFHKNLKYTADLKGEYGTDERTSRTLGADDRSVDESLLLSAPIVATLDAAEGSQPEKTFTFDFGASTPIPINATDLVLQVVYRGQMGDETDGIAVATKDLAEPTYVGIMNSLDFDVGSDGKIFKVDPPPPPRNESIGFSTDATAQPIAFVNQLAVGEFARAAILVDPEHYLLHCKCDPQTEKNLNDSAINAVDESNPANILTSPYRALRGAYLGVLSSDWTYTFNFVAAYYGERPDFLPLNGPQDSVLVRISKTTDPVVPLLKLKPFTTIIDYAASPNVAASVAAPKGVDGEPGVATREQLQSTDGHSKSGRRIAPINPAPVVTQSVQ